MTKIWQRITVSSNDPMVLGQALCPNETREEQLRAVVILSMVNSMLSRDRFAYALVGSFLALSTGEDLVTNLDVAEYMWQTTDTSKTLLMVTSCLEQLEEAKDIEYLPSLAYLGSILASEGLSNASNG